MSVFYITIGFLQQEIFKSHKKYSPHNEAYPIRPISLTDRQGIFLFLPFLFYDEVTKLQHNILDKNMLSISIMAP